MEEKIYKIILGDGTEISNLKLNGNNFISTEKIEESVFADNCSPVTISDGTTETVHPNMELVQIVEQVPGEYWFVLRDISEEEFARTKMQSDIAYIADDVQCRALRRRITMEHSKNYSKVKLWYSMKMWNETRVRNAVKMGWITKEEFAEITGKDYE